MTVGLNIASKKSDYLLEQQEETPLSSRSSHRTVAATNMTTDRIISPAPAAIRQSWEKSHSLVNRNARSNPATGKTDTKPGYPSLTQYQPAITSGSVESKITLPCRTHSPAPPDPNIANRVSMIVTHLTWQTEKINKEIQSLEARLPANSGSVPDSNEVGIEQSSTAAEIAGSKIGWCMHVTRSIHSVMDVHDARQAHNLACIQQHLGPFYAKALTCFIDLQKDFSNTIHEPDYFKEAHSIIALMDVYTYTDNLTFINKLRSVEELINTMINKELSYFRFRLNHQISYGLQNLILSTLSLLSIKSATYRLKLLKKEEQEKHTQVLIKLYDEAGEIKESNNINSYPCTDSTSTNTSVTDEQENITRKHSDQYKFEQALVSDKLESAEKILWENKTPEIIKLRTMGDILRHKIKENIEESTHDIKYLSKTSSFLEPFQRTILSYGPLQEYIINHLSPIARKMMLYVEPHSDSANHLERLTKELIDKQWINIDCEKTLKLFKQINTSSNTNTPPGQDLLGEDLKAVWETARTISALLIDSPHSKENLKKTALALKPLIQDKKRSAKLQSSESGKHVLKLITEQAKYLASELFIHKKTGLSGCIDSQKQPRKEDKAVLLEMSPYMFLLNDNDLQDYYTYACKVWEPTIKKILKEECIDRSEIENLLGFEKIVVCNLMPNTRVLLKKLLSILSTESRQLIEMKILTEEEKDHLNQWIQRLVRNAPGITCEEVEIDQRLSQLFKTDNTDDNTDNVEEDTISDHKDLILAPPPAFQDTPVTAPSATPVPESGNATDTGLHSLPLTGVNNAVPAHPVVIKVTAGTRETHTQTTGQTLHSQTQTEGATTANRLSQTANPEKHHQGTQTGSQKQTSSGLQSRTIKTDHVMTQTAEAQKPETISIKIQTEPSIAQELKSTSSEGSEHSQCDETLQYPTQISSNANRKKKGRKNEYSMPAETGKIITGHAQTENGAPINTPIDIKTIKASAKKFRSQLKVHITTKELQQLLQNDKAFENQWRRCPSDITTGYLNEYLASLRQAKEASISTVDKSPGVTQSITPPSSLLTDIPPKPADQASSAEPDVSGQTEIPAPLAEPTSSPQDAPVTGNTKKHKKKKQRPVTTNEMNQNDHTTPKSTPQTTGNTAGSSPNAPAVTNKETVKPMATVPPRVNAKIRDRNQGSKNPAAQQSLSSEQSNNPTASTHSAKVPLRRHDQNSRNISENLTQTSNLTFDKPLTEEICRDSQLSLPNDTTTLGQEQCEVIMTVESDTNEIKNYFNQKRMLLGYQYQGDHKNQLEKVTLNDVMATISPKERENFELKGQLENIKPFTQTLLTAEESDELISYRTNPHVFPMLDESEAASRCNQTTQVAEYTTMPGSGAKPDAFRQALLSAQKSGATPKKDPTSTLNSEPFLLKINAPCGGKGHVVHLVRSKASGRFMVIDRQKGHFYPVLQPESLNHEFTHEAYLFLYMKNIAVYRAEGRLNNTSGTAIHASPQRLETANTNAQPIPLPPSSKAPQGQPSPPATASPPSSPAPIIAGRDNQDKPQTQLMTALFEKIRGITPVSSLTFDQPLTQEISKDCQPSLSHDVNKLLDERNNMIAAAGGETDEIKHHIEKELTFTRYQHGKIRLDEAKKNLEQYPNNPEFLKQLDAIKPLTQTQLTAEELNELKLYRMAINIFHQDHLPGVASCQSFVNSIEYFLCGRGYKRVIGINQQLDMDVPKGEPSPVVCWNLPDLREKYHTAFLHEIDPDAFRQALIEGQKAGASQAQDSTEKLNGERYLLLRTAPTGDEGHFVNLVRSKASGRFIVIDGQKLHVYPVLHPESKNYELTDEAWNDIHNRNLYVFRTDLVPDVTMKKEMERSYELIQNTYTKEVETRCSTFN